MSQSICIIYVYTKHGHAFLDLEPGEAFDHLVGASIHYRIAIGPNAGGKALTLRTVQAQPEPFASTLLAKQPVNVALLTVDRRIVRYPTNVIEA